MPKTAATVEHITSNLLNLLPYISRPNKSFSHCILNTTFTHITYILYYKKQYVNKIPKKKYNNICNSAKYVKVHNIQG